MLGGAPPQSSGLVPSVAAMDPAFDSGSADRRLEPALGMLDAQLADAVRSLKSATRALKKAQDAARTGNLRDIKRLLEAAADSAEGTCGTCIAPRARGPSQEKTTYRLTVTWTNCERQLSSLGSGVFASWTAGCIATQISYASRVATLQSGSAKGSTPASDLLISPPF